MKKKILKIIALVVALALIGGLGWMANGLLGNPISKALATHTARTYLEETYPDTDYYIDGVNFSFKTTSYFAHVYSPSSIDTHFSLHIDMLGRLYLDTYDSVTRGFNTAQRLEDQYRALTEPVIRSLPFPSDIGYGTLAIFDPRDPEVPPYALYYHDLEIDKDYDIRRLGAAHGCLVVYADSDQVTAEEAARIMLAIRQHFDEAGVPFKALDFQLQYPRPLEGPRPDDFIGASSFLYEDIYEEGLVERVKAADKALKAYYAQQDALK